MFRLDTNNEYFSSNAPFNAFSSLASTSIGGTVVQPLLRGAGVEFNRIAGTGIVGTPVPGIYNGIVIARLNVDISLMDFETAVRSLLIDVERAYWDLALAYRDLDAKIAARDSAMQSWRFVYRKLQAGAVGGDEEAEARAREQYYVLQAQVENAYSGAPPVSAVLGNTSGTATVGNSSGVLGTERKLRLLMGLSPTDARLIRPATDPTRAEMVFDWRSSVNDALTRRLELHRQLTMIKRRGTQLKAAHSFGLPTLDLVGGANYRTFNTSLSPALDPNLQLNGGINNFNYNAGVTFAMPLGNRVGKTAIRNAELQLARERAVLCEQEKQVVHELSSAMTELDRAFALMNTNYQRRLAAEQQLAAVTRKYQAGADSPGLRDGIAASLVRLGKRLFLVGDRLQPRHCRGAARSRHAPRLRRGDPGRRAVASEGQPRMARSRSR